MGKTWRHNTIQMGRRRKKNLKKAKLSFFFWVTTFFPLQPPILLFLLHITRYSLVVGILLWNSIMVSELSWFRLPYISLFLRLHFRNRIKDEVNASMLVLIWASTLLEIPSITGNLFQVLLKSHLFSFLVLFMRLGSDILQRSIRNGQGLRRRIVEDTPPHWGEKETSHLHCGG